MTQTPKITKGAPPISDAIMKILEEELPSFFSREIAAEKTNGLFAKNSLSNLEQLKLGPPIHYMGRRAYYVKQEFLDWMRNYFGGMDVEYHGFGRRVCIRKNITTGEGEGS